jgi:zinc transporter ZupT
MESMSTVAASSRAFAVSQRQPGLARAGGSSMERALCWGTLGLAALLVLLFAVDLFVGAWPLFGASPALDIFAILAGGIIIYICIDTLRELK